MVDFRSVQRTRLYDGTNDRSFVAAQRIYVQLTDGTNVQSLDGSGNLSVILAANDGVDIGDVTINNASIPVTQSGTWNIATVTTLTGITNDVNIADGGNSITVDDGGASITVDGAVTVSATDLDIRDLAATQDNVLVYANTAKDGTGTNYVPVVTSDGYLRVDIASGSSGRTEYSDGAAQAGHVGAVVMGTDGTNLQSISVDASGNVQTDIVAPLPAGTNSIGDIGTVTTLTGITNDVNIADGGNVISIDDAGGSLTVDGTVAATQSGTWNIATLTGITNDVNIADGGNSITVDDGGASLTVDGTVAISGTVTVAATDLDIRDLTSASDSVEVLQDTHDDLNANVNLQVADTDVSSSNPVPVQIVDASASASEVHDYNTTASVAKDASTNHDYTVANTTAIVKEIHVAASGQVKVEVLSGPLASLTTKLVTFTNSAELGKRIVFNPPLEIPATSTGTLRITITNFDNQAQDVYSTAMLNDV